MIKGKTENIKEKMMEKIKGVREWMSTPIRFFCLKTAIFAFVVFFWTYMICGFPLAAAISAVCSVVISFFKYILQHKKKIYGILLFWGITISQFTIIYLCVTPGAAWFSLLTWFVVYITFNKATSLLEWAAGAFIPLGIVMYAEFLQNNVKIALKILFDMPNAGRFGYAASLVLIAIVSTFFIKVFNNKRIGYCISIGLFALLCNINFFVYALTEQPFTLSDLNIATTAAGVLNTQKLEPKDWVKFAFGILILAMFYIIILSIYKRKESKKKFLQWAAPVTVLCGILIVAYMAGNWLYSTLLLYNGHVKYGFIGNFYVTMNDKINMPEDVENYVIEDVSYEGNNNPNVIIVMNEAFCDFGATFNVTLSEDPLKYFHELQTKFPSGITYSSVKGNNTCSSEWELLSGSPTALTAKGAMIYQNNCKPMRSLVSLFNDRGYTTVGLHPYYSFGYNRDSFYSALGFDKKVFIEDIPSGQEKIRNYITDEANYKILIELFEQNEREGNAPFFCFNITMQNHGSYSNMQMDDVRVIGDKEYKDINTYLSVLKRSDEALKGLISYFESVEEDTIILFFGDHQPMIDKEFYEDIYKKEYSALELEELTQIYAIPYLIWANYDIDKDAAPEETSNCYLSTILFDVGRIPKSVWLDMTGKYMNEFPVVTSIFIKDKYGEVKTKESIIKDDSSLSGDVLREYQKYSYGILYGQ